MTLKERENYDRAIAAVQRHLGLIACNKLWASFVMEQQLYNRYIARGKALGLSSAKLIPDRLP